MYFNKIDRECEGFYPELKYRNGYEQVIIKFQLCYYRGVDKYWWTQINESVIYGFTTKTGKELMGILNSQVNITVERSVAEGAGERGNSVDVSRRSLTRDDSNIQMTATKIYNSGGRCIYPMELIDSTFYLIAKDTYIK
jgi:hypothetical protein